MYILNDDQRKDIIEMHNTLKGVMPSNTWDNMNKASNKDVGVSAHWAPDEGKKSSYRYLSSNGSRGGINHS